VGEDCSQLGLPAYLLLVAHSATHSQGPRIQLEFAVDHSAGSHASVVVCAIDEIPRFSAFCIEISVALKSGFCIFCVSFNDFVNNLSKCSVHMVSVIDCAK